MRLHHATYRAPKEQCPGLVSDLLIQARVKATEALKPASTWKAKHEASYPKRVAKAEKRGTSAPKFKPVKCPQSILCPIRYNEKTYHLDWQRQQVNLASSTGRLLIPVTVPHFSVKYQGYPVATVVLTTTAISMRPALF